MLLVSQSFLLFLFFISLSLSFSSSTHLPAVLSLSTNKKTNIFMKGGANLVASTSGPKGSRPVVNTDIPQNKVVLTFSSVALATWSVLQVVLVIGNAVRRLVPIALQPFAQKDLVPYQWGLYGAWVLYMIYTEGYQAFQLKFSPLLVKRAYLLNDNLTFMRVLLAGPYSMGLFGATKKRMIVSWAVSTGVFALVAIVKRLPYPWRSIIDAGVVAGLTYGTLATVAIFIRGLFGVLPSADPCLPLTDAEIAVTNSAKKAS